MAHEIQMAMQSLDEIYLGAREIPDGSERAAYLTQACGADADLRRGVEAMLQAAAGAEDFFAAAEGSRRESPTLTEQPGTVIGRYKLLEKIGEGGMGVVYRAGQRQPVVRQVALKIIKAGMDTRQVIARFEAERQTLALMDHPNIAKVLDGGETDTGRPYFVMDLVQGLPITQFCDEAKLSTGERLDLFLEVCSAIQHAHQKGIIHRDIKPSNILVTLQGGKPVPKVIDFGIAKATQQRLTDRTLFTQFAAFLGTPAYMSPEQAAMTSPDIDTRSDIYSLGVLLYELLTGTTPFDKQELLKAGFDEMRRIIRETEPERPSTRLTTLQGRMGEKGKGRGLGGTGFLVATDPGSVGVRPSPAAGKPDGALGQGGANAPVTPGVSPPEDGRPALPHRPSAIDLDLDWIVMKCLEKDRAWRYETVNGLTADIHRHMSNEPIAAHPPSTLYRFQKLVRRNKLFFAMVTAVAAALILGVVASTWQATQARRARVNEGQARAAAEQRLYDSLLREARATRVARRVGYRERVFGLLQQAHALDVTQTDPTELRREAVACLGDVVGLVPRALRDLPGNAHITQTRLSPGGQLAAFLLFDGTIVLRELPSANEVAALKNEHPARSLTFNATGDRFISVHLPFMGSDQEQLGQATLGRSARAPPMANGARRMKFRSPALSSVSAPVRRCSSRSNALAAVPLTCSTQAVARWSIEFRICPNHDRPRWR
jgi:serine/threonine protein kinase